MLELPEEVAATAAAPGGAGEQLQTQAAAGPAPAVANGGGGGASTSSKAKSKAKPKPAAGGQEAEGDPFSRIEIKVGRITKVGGSTEATRGSRRGGDLSVGWVSWVLMSWRLQVPPFAEVEGEVLSVFFGCMYLDAAFLFFCAFHLFGGQA